MNVAIRPEKAGDAEIIGAITEAAFSASAYGHNGEAQIVSALREADALSLSLVAETAEMVIGHVAVSPVRISDGAQGWHGLGPISVLPNYQYKGVGSLLMRAALDELKLSGASGCILVGDPKYYGRFGFNNVPDLVYPGVPAEYFQALKFRGSFPVGTVSYHDAFGSATSHL